MKSLVLTLLLALALRHSCGAERVTPSDDLWVLAQDAGDVHRYSTLFTAQDVRDELSNEAGLQRAIQWCKATGVTRVFIESFRDGYQADRATLLGAKERFLKEKFLVSGCITPTQVGKSSTGWKDVISCYTDKPTQERIRSIFQFTAASFDETMIDDFWFTDCTCAECEQARTARLVTIGNQTYPVAGDTWEDYRCELMVRLSRDYLLTASRAVNPKAALIIKYPQWYDRFHERGYEVTRQTADFDKIWVGTETRDYEDANWGGTPQYEAYFIMRWLGGIGGEKCGGGWFDPLGTTEATYLEQARQTILGGARESLLFCYGALQHETGPKNIAALRQNLPELLKVAGQVRHRAPIGIAAYKPANSHPQKEARVFDFLGMLGVPLVPCHEFPTNAPAAFLSVHALRDAALADKLKHFVAAGKPVLVTDGLAAALGAGLSTSAKNVIVLPVKGTPKSLLELPEVKVEEIRNTLFQPFKWTLNAPKRVAVYVFSDGSSVVENFNNSPVTVTLNGKERRINARGWDYDWK